jgi:hypothetical protein
MNIRALARTTLLWVLGIVAVTAILGGTALVVGTLAPALYGGAGLPLDYLDGSPFTSFLVPGILLAALLGGVHLVAFVLLKTRNRWGMFAAAAAGFAMLIWIFVQMTIIPFSPLQALYFVVGLLELGLVTVALGLFDREAARDGRPAAPQLAAR